MQSAAILVYAGTNGSDTSTVTHLDPTELRSHSSQSSLKVRSGKLRGLLCRIYVSFQSLQLFFLCISDCFHLSDTPGHQPF